VYYIYERLGKTDFVKRNKDDLVSEGTIGLLKAVKTYNADRSKFSTYASMCIRNQMLMLIRREKKHKNVLSLEAPAGRDAEGHELRLMDIIPDEGQGEAQIFAEIEARETLEAVLAVADGRDKRIVELRIDGKTQAEIADKLGIGGSYVSRLLKELKTRYYAALKTEVV
jgi:RNA polymerase sporulation-specific sigma factor